MPHKPPPRARITARAQLLTPVTACGSVGAGGSLMPPRPDRAPAPLTIAWWPATHCFCAPERRELHPQAATSLPHQAMGSAHSLGQVCSQLPRAACPMALGPQRLPCYSQLRVDGVCLCRHYMCPLKGVSSWLQSDTPYGLSPVLKI